MKFVLAFFFAALIPCVSFAADTPSKVERVNRDKQKSAESTKKFNAYMASRISYDNSPEAHKRRLAEYRLAHGPDPLIDAINKRSKSIKLEKFNGGGQGRDNFYVPGKPRPVRDIVPNRQSSYPISKPVGSH